MENRCINCGGIYKNKKDDLFIEHPFFGQIYLPYVEFDQCEQCSDTLLPSKTCEIFKNKSKAVFSQWILKHPLKDFMTSSEVAKRLNISISQLRKDKRIMKGFIYHIKIGNIILYLGKSVNLYLKNGDGRFKLNG
jgi:hypothetical protein